MAGAWGDEDGIAGGDGAGEAVDFDGSGAIEDEIDFLAELVEVAGGGGAGGQGGFGERLVLDGGVGVIEQAADGAAVFGGEGRLLGEGVAG